MKLLLAFILLSFPFYSFANKGSVLKYAVSAGIVDRKPALVGEVFSNNIDKLYFFTKVKYYNWNEESDSFVTHVWYYNNKPISTVELKINASTWRTYSTKSITPNSTGEWRVEAIDSNGNILATQTFNIIEKGS